VFTLQQILGHTTLEMVRRYVNLANAHVMTQHKRFSPVDRMTGMKPKDEEAAEEIRKLWGYLKENQGRVKYGSLRRKGYPIGSGGIESANKFISHVRLKRSGAWWYVERATRGQEISSL
jgi:hypothetical protein